MLALPPPPNNVSDISEMPAPPNIMILPSRSSTDAPQDGSKHELLKDIAVY